MIGSGGRIGRLADVFVPSWISGEPQANLVRAAYGVRLLVGISALAFTWAIPATGEQRVLHALLVGLVYVPWSVALFAVSRRSEGPVLRLASLAGDVLVVFMFQATIPSVHVVGMFGFMLITAHYAFLGGLPGGLAVAGASVALTAAAQSITGEGVPGYTLLMFGAALISEVSLLHAMTKQQRLAALALRDLDRLKDEFLASISHELRTPLTSIDGFSRTLLRRWESLTEDEKVEFVDLIFRNAEELRYLIEQLLDFSRLEAERFRVSPKPMDLTTAVTGCVEALDPAVNAIRVKLEVQEGLRAVADPNAIRRILSNLLINAAKFSPADAPIVVGGAGRNGDVVVSVRDEGIGIPARDRERIFDPFYQAYQAANGSAEAVRGTGVGLAVARRYVESHGGRIWVESRPGAGSTFFFTLPRAQPSK